MQLQGTCRVVDVAGHNKTSVVRRISKASRHAPHEPSGVFCICAREVGEGGIGSFMRMSMRDCF